MSVRLAVLAWLSILAPTSASAQVPPPGWRFALGTDRHIDAERVSLDSTRARADFDGNGTVDDAAILVRTAAPTAAQAVFVFLLQGNGDYTTRMLGEVAASSGEFALSVTAAGCFINASTQVKVCLPHSGLALYEIEFGTGTLHWYSDGEWQQTDFSPGEFDGVPF
jgi:hypothetical protein